MYSTRPGWGMSGWRYRPPTYFVVREDTGFVAGDALEGDMAHSGRSS